MWYSYPNRTLCDCLDELRALIRRSERDKHERNTLLSLVEECQTYANRMEAAMQDADDVRKLHKRKKKLKNEIKKLEKKSEDNNDEKVSDLSKSFFGEDE